jgi:alanine-synthesizing transaminase
VYYDCKAENGWQPDVEQIAAAVTPRTKAIVVINPNNPTGAVYSDKTLLGILEIARVNGLVVFSDEIYDKVLFDETQHVPMASLADDVLVLTFGGLSKNYRACGFRSGWMYLTGPVENASNYIEGIDMLASMRLCANVTAQFAVQIALGGYQSITELCKPKGRLGHQRDYSYERLSKMEGIKCFKPLGAMYVFPEIDVDQFDFSSDEEMVHKLLIEQKVLTVQGSGFNYYNSAAFRAAFLPHVDMLSEAFDRIEDFLEKHRVK